MLLTACTPKALPTTEVLERATLASQKLSSAAFSVSIDGTYESRTGLRMVGRMTTKGKMRQNGSAMSQDIDADVTFGTAISPAHANISLTTAVIDEESFFRINSLQLRPDTTDNAFAFMRSLSTVWWSMPGGSSTGSIRISPDPNVLKAEAAIVNVVRDNGIIEIDDGHAYHYEVSLNREKFNMWLQKSGQWSENEIEQLSDVTARGELWIDARTFYLKKAVWQIDSAPILDGNINARIEVLLSEHDKPQEIAAPANARPFSWDALPLGIRPSLESESDTLP